MNYYPFHLGDYAAHTAHLEPMEDLAYRRMLDVYYLCEGSLPADPAEVARLIRMRQNMADVEAVLREFFKLTEDGWRHVRCDAEIARMKDKQTKARASAEASVKSRQAKAQRAYGVPETIGELDLNVRQASAQRPPSVRLADVELPTPTPTPIIEEGLHPSLSAAPKSALPDCPQQKLIAIYAKHLPHLTQPRTWEGARAKAMRQRWREAAAKSAYNATGYANEADGLHFWEGFFSHVAEGTKLAKGFDSNGRHWEPDLPWLLTAGNFAKIIDGKYDL